jgi:predicted Zn-dependent protease
MSLLCGLLLYAVASLFAAGEATPVIGVHFFIFLALLAATLCPQQSIHDATSTQTVHASSFSMSASRWTARLILCVGVASVVCATPWLVRTGRAHLIYDRALQTTSLPRRVALLRQARDLDLEQPIYWAQLAQAQLSMHGTPVARAATNVYRAAALRSPNDALFWHNIAALFGTAGDATNVIRNETRAMLADPTFAPYQEVLAQAYAQLGNRKKAEAHMRLAEQFRTRGHQNPDMAQIPARYRRRVVQPDFVSAKLPALRNALWPPQPPRQIM